MLPFVYDWKKQIALAKEKSDPTASELTNNILEVRQFVQKHKSVDEREIYEARMALEDIAMNIVPTPNSDSMFDAIHVAYGEKELLSENIEAYLSTKDCTTKTIEMNRRDLVRFSTRFTFAEDATELEVRAWANLTLGERKSSYLLQLEGVC